MSVLRLEGFGLSFHDKVILKSVDMLVGAAGITVILGPSGTGKSSLLRTLAGFNDANPSLRVWGIAEYEGRPLGETKRPALVMQKATLMVSSVHENLLTGYVGRSSMTRMEQVSFLTDFCNELGQHWVAEKLSASVVDLPLREKRAIAILHEVLAGPALLMLDEPTANLADEDAEWLCGLIRNVAQRQPVLMVSHHLAQAKSLASHIVLMADGVTQESAAVERFFGQPASAAARQFIMTGSCAEGVRHEEPEADLPGHLAPVAAAQSNVRSFKSQYMGPRGFVWLLPGQLAGTPWPGLIRDVGDDLQSLKDVGVTRLVSLTELPFDGRLAGEYDMACSSVPMPDMKAPPLVEAEALCRDIDEWISGEEVVAVHCRAGLGRTGTILAAYWLWLGRGRRSALDAIVHVRRMESGMIQSQEQVSFLSEFDQHVREARSRAIA